MNILILNGPNLNLLGSREPEIYGTTTLAEIEAMCRAHTPETMIDFRQSNHEGELVEWIQQATHAGIILNAAAYTHTSVAIHDALKHYVGATAPNPTANAASLPAFAVTNASRSVGVPAKGRRLVEVHLSNPHKREPFRHNSYISPLAEAVICGLGTKGYLVALDYLIPVSGQSANRT